MNFKGHFSWQLTMIFLPQPSTHTSRANKGTCVGNISPTRLLVYLLELRDPVYLSVSTYKVDVVSDGYFFSVSCSIKHLEVLFQKTYSVKEVKRVTERHFWFPLGLFWLLFGVEATAQVKQQRTNGRCDV